MGITTSGIATILGVSSRDVGTLCSSPLINPWSKWKPIYSSVVTMTLEELKLRNYGIEILRGNSVTQLFNKVVENGNKGYKYNRPTGGSAAPYRLGDFRNYEHQAFEPMSTTYKNGDVQNIGGYTSSNEASYKKYLMGVEVNDGTDDSVPYLTMGDLCDMTNASGEAVQFYRGALVTDGTNSYWASDYIPWYTSNFQKFSGKTVTVFEFLTNALNNPDYVYEANAEDVFFSLPNPIVTIDVSGNVPSGSKKVGWLMQALFLDEYYGSVKITVYFHAIGDVYRGGTIINVWLGIYKDKNGMNLINSKKIIDSIMVAKGEKTSTYEVTLTNLTDSPCYAALFFDNSLQDSFQPMYDRNWGPE